ncbi:HK97-gp10 family putative phage morphogenesis protein [Paenibacillus alvei]|uniref:HK97-gp10 family putative phage morphogenesis protein n=1 Tax=Paenibacillus alvei TaxID=44250 RepID=UPI0018CF20A1|nr:HK97-gp10 family putative phage morphogenesis protein [Paenibacillus alvei]MBG9734550.1 hypothetical protein [Paenibacillus alvei]MBG9743139.1 hypothetical protein [Paenibacillus alvei]MCY9579556.1 HK97 gp10 family phage protein [Paenibacillus alvei]MCY9586516.1 HK97 gp10 family phage protein [Paenibacillus alvei]
MADGRIELQGVDEMLRTIRARMGNGAERLVNKGLRGAGEIIADAQREKVAVSDRATQHIRDDIRVSGVRRVDGVKFVLIGQSKKTSWRAHLLEFGTKKTTAQPYIYPAFVEEKDAAKQYMIQEFQKGVRDG